MVVSVKCTYNDFFGVLSTSLRRELRGTSRYALEMRHGKIMPFHDVIDACYLRSEVVRDMAYLK